MQLEHLLRGDADLYVDTLLRQEMPYERARGHLADAKGYLRAHRTPTRRQVPSRMQLAFCSTVKSS
jgi:hypothetical protein